MSAAVLAALAALPSATAASASVATFPSSQSIAPTGPLPRGGGRQLVYNAAVGEREGALVVVRGAKSIAVSVSTPIRRDVTVRLFFAHFVAVGGRLVPDALVPWDGSERRAEHQNQPVLVQVEVPYGARPGALAGELTVRADGRTTTLPIRIRVFAVTLPRPGTRVGNLLTSFHLSPESYLAKAARLYGFGSHEQRIAANRALFAMLGSYRVSPGSWGFAEPRGPGGYESSAKWWLDSAGNFLGQLGSTPGFSALRIPISSNRTAAHNYIARLSPYEPETWCDYLRNVPRLLVAARLVLTADAVAYLFALDEPGPARQRVVARQAAVLRRCFPEGKQLMTGNPSGANTFLWDGKGGDDVDIWAVLSRRYYGKWTSPADRRSGKSRAQRASARDREGPRAREDGLVLHVHGYSRDARLRGDRAAHEPAHADALERARGRRGRAVRAGDDELRAGQSLRLDRERGGRAAVPGPSGPIPSARLEQIRDGIEDWAIFDAGAEAAGRRRRSRAAG